MKKLPHSIPGEAELVREGPFLSRSCFTLTREGTPSFCSRYDKAFMLAGSCGFVESDIPVSASTIQLDHGHYLEWSSFNFQASEQILPQEW